MMSDSRWPAIAIQSLFLILNMTFLLAGGKEINWFIIVSTAVNRGYPDRACCICILGEFMLYFK